MKCPYCKGTGKSNMWINGGNVPCNACKGTGDMEVTNEQWIRLCTTEQLAEFIVGQRKECVYADCPNGETPCMFCKDGCDIDKLVEWLKQPHQKE